MSVVICDECFKRENIQEEHTFVSMWESICPLCGINLAKNKGHRISDHIFDIIKQDRMKSVGRPQFKERT